METLLKLQRIPRSSYYDKHYKQTASLIRARRPYLVRNALTGIGMFGFCIGICEFVICRFFGCIIDAPFLDSYTILAVSQDDFDDVQVPAAPEQLPRAGASTVTSGPVIK